MENSSPTDLESQVELLEGALNLVGEHVHALALLEGHDYVGRTVLRLHLAHDLHHVELVRAAVHDFVQDSLHLHKHTSFHVEHNYFTVEQCD